MTLKQVAHWVGSVLLAGALLTSGSVTAQTGPADLAAVTLAAPSVVLYDQTNNGGSNIVDSSVWGVQFPLSVSQAADDFVVPASDFWHVTSVTANGQILPGDGAGVLSLLVQFYKNSSAGLPETLIYSETVPSGSIGGLATGIFVVNLAATLSLGPGHYWFSVQARLACTSGSCKHWGWTERTVQSNLESAWESPPGGFGAQCRTWQPRVSVCRQPSASVSPDLLFRLDGTVIPIPAGGRLYLPLIHR